MQHFKRLLWFILLLDTIISADGFSIEEIQVTPAGLSQAFYSVVPLGSNVVVETHIVTGEAPVFLSKPTIVERTGGKISITIFPATGGIELSSSLRERNDIGALPLGDYLLDVTIHPPPFEDTGTTNLWHIVSIRPRLEVQRRSEGLLIRWPLVASRYLLEVADASIRPLQWHGFPTVPQQDDTHFFVADRAVNKFQIYRLRQRPRGGPR